MSENTQRAALESVRQDTIDPTLSIGDTVFCGGVYATVTGIHSYAPGMHDDSPIKNEMTAVEVVTDNGSRWHGRESRHVQEREAQEVGRNHGYNHANYVDAYGGDMDEEPSVPLRFAGVETYYTAAYAEGVERYRTERYDD